MCDKYSLFLFFFFKQKTAYEMRISDWSSDVCSSDLAARIGRLAEADHQDVARDAEIFDRAGERKAVRRDDADVGFAVDEILRSEEHTSELQSLMRISYAVLCLKKRKLIANKHIAT